ncbi:MAG: hypothetical protein WCA08_24325 [Desulfoferrobacter sp.]
MEEREKVSASTSENVHPEAKKFHAEVEEAQELLQYAVSEGLEVSNSIVKEIKNAEQFLINKEYPGAEQRVRFEMAYRDLANFMKPINIATLRATSDKYGRKARHLFAFNKASEAKLWSRKLWGLTFLVIIIALFGENLDKVLNHFFPVDEETQGSILTLQVVAAVFQGIVPFTYGAFGALTFLLRSCHAYIVQRSFDINRIPEYYNRILLGMVSGGTILLFIQDISTEQGPVRISAAALAFLAGYNTDFLFTTIERVIAAILPKVGLETVQKAQPQQAGSSLIPMSLERLIELRNKAETTEEKAYYEELIKRLMPA